MTSWAAATRVFLPLTVHSGCHLGTSTALLHAAAATHGGRAVGVDVSGSIVTRGELDLRWISPGALL